MHYLFRYGAVLERLLTHGDDILEKIRGCVVDSAPSAKPDPQVCDLFDRELYMQVVYIYTSVSKSSLLSGNAQSILGQTAVFLERIYGHFIPLLSFLMHSGKQIDN